MARNPPAAAIEEIQDEAFRARIVEKPDDDWSDEASDAESVTSDEEDEVTERGLIIPEESLWERISALRDIIPPSTRQSIAARISRYSTYGGVALLWGGRAVWVITTTSLLVALPLAMAVEDENRIMQQERDLMQQQQGAQQMLGGQSGSPPGMPQQGGQQQGQGIRPPGF